MEQDGTNAAHPEERGGETTKRPYSKPAFQHERVFETMALACGKIGTTTQGCALNTKNS
jgi:hypothetical protein